MKAPENTFKDFNLGTLEDPEHTVDERNTKL